MSTQEFDLHGDNAENTASDPSSETTLSPEEVAEQAERLILEYKNALKGDPEIQQAVANSYFSFIPGESNMEDKAVIFNNGGNLVSIKYSTADEGGGYAHSLRVKTFTDDAGSYEFDYIRTWKYNRGTHRGEFSHLSYSVETDKHEYESDSQRAIDAIEQSIASYSALQLPQIETPHQ